MSTKRRRKNDCIVQCSGIDKSFDCDKVTLLLQSMHCLNVKPQLICEITRLHLDSNQYRICAPNTPAFECHDCVSISTDVQFVELYRSVCINSELLSTFNRFIEHKQNDLKNNIQHI
eukprot:254770_1